MKKISLVFLLFCLITTISVEAAVEEFTGVGEYIAEDTETVQAANDIALKEAMRRISEQAAVALKSHSVVENGVLTDDEIEAVTASVIHVQEKRFVLDITEQGKLKSTAIITATVDIDKAAEMASKLLAEKSKLR